MTISEKLTAVAENQQRVYDAGYAKGQAEADTEAAYNEGVQAEYDRFWDAFQQSGNRTTYRYAFAGSAWTEETLKPKYPIKIVDTTANSRRGVGMFYSLANDNNTQFDATEICKMVDFSEAIHLNLLFCNAYAKNITVNASKATNLGQAFQCSDSGMNTNITLTVSDACTNFYNTFYYCSELTDLTFTEGSEIAASINLQWSPLSKSSIESVMAALSDTTTGTTASFKQTAVDTAFETAEGLADGSTSDAWLELVATKENWIISLG